MLTIPNIEQIVVRDSDISVGRLYSSEPAYPCKRCLITSKRGNRSMNSLDDFPTVRREQATQLLEALKQALLSTP